MKFNFENWIKDRNVFGKKTIIVVNRWDFNNCVDMTINLHDIAYISISASEDCAKYFLNDITEASHYLQNSQNVLNLNFDDVTEDIVTKNEDGKLVIYNAITDGQAKQIIDFVDNNLDKHIIIHCRAGKSRSQGVARSIYDCYSDNYAVCQYNIYNPCITPNPDVVSKIKRAFYNKNSIF